MATWFTSQHPEQVGIAQSNAVAQLFRCNAGLIACMMALGLASQLHAGFGWMAMAWIVAIGALAWTSFANVRRLGTPASADADPVQPIRHLTFTAAATGAGWALGLLAWASPAHPQLALIAVAVSLTFALHAAATAYALPWAVIALSVPLLLASIVVCLRTLESPAESVGVVLVALNGLATWRVLRRNWRTFTQAIALDVERQRVSAMVHEQKAMAEKAVQVKTRFLASAAHDLRQPMHAISLYLDGLAETPLPDRVREVIADARVCAHDMNDMFRSLLDISRLDAQQTVPQLSVFSIAGVLSRVEKEFLPLAASRGVRLKVRPCADHVYSDPVMVERIALNFVSNAVRHTTNGRILVACRVRGRSLRLAVYDTGRGIPESQQKAVFDEFHRIDTRPLDDTGGLGLGLAIVRRLAVALRLPVLVRSEVGRGSMFAVDLPLMHVSRGRPQPAAAESKLAGRMVVVVDDEPSILQAASFILQTAGCNVIGARSGTEALETLGGSTRVPDLIVCDYELNDKYKGPEVIRLLREEFNSEIPALLVTGDTAGGIAERSARDLGVPVLYKPLDASALRTRLEELLITAEQ